MCFYLDSFSGKCIFHYFYLLLSNFDHLNYDEKQEKSIIALSAMYKIKYIHKIIKSKSLKCTFDISCYQLIENKENNG